MEIRAAFPYQNLINTNTSCNSEIQSKSSSNFVQRPTEAQHVSSPTVNHLREAYQNKNVEHSRKLHNLRRIHPSSSLTYHAEHHNGTSSEYLKAIVFGGLDGIVTLFAIVAGCVGAHLTPTQTIIVGLCNLFADAVSMGFGEYVSAKTESDFIESEKNREIWEVDHFPDEEKREMLEIYLNKHHFSLEDAQTMVSLVFKYKDFCISHMMAEELGILLDENSPSPCQRGAVMFLAFNLFGVIPLAGYGLCYIMTLSLFSETNPSYRDIIAFLFTSFLSCVTLFGLGFSKATFINQSKIKSGLQVMLNGIVAGLVAFSIGIFLQNTIGTNALT